MSEEESVQKELKRRIDYQIEENRHLETQAGLILRSWGVLVGGVLTVIIAISSGRVSPPNVPQTDTVTQAETLAETVPFMSYSFATLFLLVMVIISALLFIISLSYIFLLAPLSAVHVLEFSDLQPNPALKTHHLEGGISSQQLKKNYNKCLVHNHREIKKTRESWKRCNRSLSYGAKYLSSSAIALSAVFLVFNRYLSLISFSLVIYVTIDTVRRNAGGIKPYLLTYKPVDITYLSMMSATILVLIALEHVFPETLPDEVLFAPGFLVLGLAPHFPNLDQKTHKRLIIRTLGILITSVMMGMGIIMLYPASDSSVYLDILPFAVIGAVFSSIYLLAFLLGPYAVIRAADFVREFKKKRIRA